MIFHEGMNPFLSDSFVRVEQNMRDDIVRGEPCVILATSGMLNSGPVMEYLKALGPQPNNTLVFVGYQERGRSGGAYQKGWKSCRCQTTAKPPPSNEYEYRDGLMDSLGTQTDNN